MTHLPSLVDPVTDYANKVLSGEIIAGPYVRGAAQRHLDDLQREDLFFDIEQVQRVIDFFSEILYVLKEDPETGRQQYDLFEPLPWQQFCLGSIFGWYRRNGLRRFRVFYDETAKGSGKSPMLGGIGLYMLIADGEAAAECYAAATKKDQAMILFRDAVAMVKASSPLKGRLQFSGGQMREWQIYDIRTESFFRPISSDDSQSGPRPYAALVDEIHEHKDGSVIEMLEAGFKFRRNPLLVMATNSGSDRQSVCYSYHQHAVNVCTGVVNDDEFFGYVAALDKGDNAFEDRTCWIKANPSLGHTIKEDYLESRIARALAIPGKLNELLRLNFCVWTDAADAWVTMPTWESVQGSVDQVALNGMKCFGGLDLSSKKDLTALTLVFPTHKVSVDVEDDDGNLISVKKWFYEIVTWFWTPRDTMLEREKEDRVPYSEWVDGGHLIAPDGKIIDYGFVAAKLVELNELFDIKTIAFDPHKIEYLQEELVDLGSNISFSEHSQGFWKAKETGLWMPNSITELEDAILQKRCKFHINPVMTWNVQSAVFRSDEHENRKFDKRKATGRIDGCVSTAMAIGVAEAPLETYSPYEDPDFTIASG